ncbi:Retrotransposon gag protein [Gossypium australe]|uniref:Retrotransposon gag protein n=1 Tax=Gossypium australe TaxID=47621 RepID=A0A5B6V9E4_9ROSI|nr:Retrotransposon gag protein [Gossypium australe]
MALSEALYGQKSRNPLYWTELSEKKLFNTDLIRETKEKVKVIRNSLKAATYRKLSPRFIRSYEIIERIEPLAYLLALSSELDEIHNVFHVSMLRRYRSDPLHVISPGDIEI